MQPTRKKLLLRRLAAVILVHATAIGATANSLAQVPTFVQSWGGLGPGLGQFAFPSAVATDHQGHVYVSDMQNCRIEMFSASGEFAAAWGEQGSYGSGVHFLNPIGLAAVDPDRVWVADAGNNLLKGTTSTGGQFFQGGYPPERLGVIAKPQGVAVSASGEVFVSWLSYPGATGIRVFDEYGSFLRSWVAGPSPAGVAITRSGTILVTDLADCMIREFSVLGDLLATWGGCGSGDGEFSEPSGIAAGPDGNIYVADSGNNRIQVLSASGTFLGKWGHLGDEPSEFYRPYGVAVDESGMVYVADLGNHRIQKFGFGAVTAKQRSWAELKQAFR